MRQVICFSIKLRIRFASLLSKKAILICLIMICSVGQTQELLKFSTDLIEKISAQYGSSAAKRISKWATLTRKLSSESDDEKLYQINNFFNSIPYKSDLAHWGKSDYWATPIEMLGTNGGDCEDYVIAKYFSLRQLGIPDSKLRMMFVTALSVNQAHMVLAYYPEPNAIPLILDNINPRILPANKRRDLRPVYSFNGEGLWLAKAQGRGSQCNRSPRPY